MEGGEKRSYCTLLLLLVTCSMRWAKSVTSRRSFLLASNLAKAGTSTTREHAYVSSLAPCCFRERAGLNPLARALECFAF